MRTERVTLGAIVSPPSRRRPWKLARETMTLDRLSNGRLVLPVGLGALDDGAFGNVGEPTDARTRAEMLDESLAILEGLWSGEPFGVRRPPLPVRADDLPTDAGPATAHPDLGRRGVGQGAVGRAGAPVRRDPAADERPGRHPGTGRARRTRATRPADRHRRRGHDAATIPLDGRRGDRARWPMPERRGGSSRTGRGATVDSLRRRIAAGPPAVSG